MARFSLSGLLLGDGQKARVIRGSAFTLLNYGGAQVLRLVSNLILTRLLFPEAFGLMALLNVFAIGMELITDTGIKSSIIQSKRGHDPVYLNTAWTVQAGRGILLWLVACACAGPIADFYEQDILAVLFPVTALTLVIHGFASTKEATTQKKIMLGRITAITLGTQVLGIIVNVVLALILQSVWSLVFGGLVASTVRMILTHTALPGERNRLAWNSEVFWDLFHFGKYIMIGSAAGFMVNQGDRAILGKFVTLTDLAVYNIGWMFAALPMTLSRVLGRRILFPLYAEAPPKESAANRHNISKVRFAISGGMLSVALLLGLIGDVMIRTLYLPEYHLAGAILVLVAASVAPTIILSAYGGLLLGSGSSRDFTVMLIVTATVQTTLLYYGVSAYGLIGAILAPGLAQILVYPLTVFLVRRHGGWDPRHDGVFALVAIGIAVIVLLVHPDALSQVTSAGS